MQHARAGLVFDIIAKSFGGVEALKGVSLQIKRGEILALLGENGAGKSTLIKILGGIHKADHGSVMIDGIEYVHQPNAKPNTIEQRQKIAFIHQDLGLIEWMSVTENIALAVGYKKRAGVIAWRECEKQARHALTLVACDFDPSMRVSALSRTEKSLVAIARALAVECDFLVLDEPTASLPADEVERLFAALKPLKEKGVGMIYVSHRLDEIFRIADRVAVLRDGQMVGMRDIVNTNPDDLIALIIGKETRQLTRPEVTSDQNVLKVDGLYTEATDPVSFHLRQGEVLALVGLRGAGHEEIGRALYGLYPAKGDILLNSETLDRLRPQSAMQAGIGFVARDRLVESVTAGRTICENIFINPCIRNRSILSLQKPTSEHQAAKALGITVGVSPNDPTLAIEALSGGNQQKIVIGRWLNTGRKLLITEDPTAGVDIGAKAEIYALLYDALKTGMGILIISTDFEEVAHICHRALVFSQGHLVAELKGEVLTTQSLILAASASNHQINGAQTSDAQEGKVSIDAIH